jgi:hypothetical protein
MKKICLIVTVLLVLGAAVLFADDTSNLYARTVQIVKVYPHHLGYKVTYLTSKLTYGTTYLPQKWFTQAAFKDGVQAKGELFWGVEDTYPYMIVFWENGKFSHVRLFLHKSMHDISYGVIRGEEDPAAFDIEEIKLQY